MSLNGLDDVKVKEAYETAAAEPGGWFLLKYISRDEVELLERGNGGIVEIRNSIAQFEDPAPLFGFLRYRRRNVVIRYLPEDCSRLVQARVTVHFTAVTERFSPHDTEFSISSSKELRDTTLSAACLLHTASGSASSSVSSLRRRRLMEIAEDAEEDDRAKSQSTVAEAQPSTAGSPSITGASISLPASPPRLPTTDSYRSVISSLETSPPPPREPNTDARPKSPAKTLDERRISSQSMRPDLYSLSSYGSNGKPKIKLGPRPSLDVVGRPHTSSATSHFRPVSTLPPGLKIQNKSPKKDKDVNNTQAPIEPPNMTIIPPPIPETMPSSLQIPLTRPHTSGGRPTTSSGASIKSVTSPKNAPFQKLPTMTPEKARLLRAMELRKRREMAPPPAPDDASPADIDQAPTTPALADSGVSMVPLKEVHDTLSMLSDMTKGEDSFDANSTIKTDESDATRSDSYPVSPTLPSEQAGSTKASSISESTEETILELPKAFEETENLVDGTVHESPREIEEAEGDEDAIREPEMKQEEMLTETERAMDNNLPFLPSIAYTPISSPMENQVKHAANTLESENHDASTEIETKTTQTPSLARSPTPEASKDLHSEADIPKASIELPDEEINIEFPSEPAAVSPALAKPEFKEWKVPRSKFSSQNLRAAYEAPTVPCQPMPLSANDSAANVAPKSPVDESTSSIDTKRSDTEDDGQENSLVAAKRKKRRAIVEPIRTGVTELSAADSEANSSDDELMEELQSAVIQDAQPISVAKSPMSPVFPSTKKKISNRFSRSVTNPMRRDTLDPQKLLLPEIGRSDSSRSVSASAAYLNRINQQPAMPMAKKVNLGSGISSRIKALEKLSTNAEAAASPGTSAPSTVASPAFFSVRKGTVRGTSKSPSVAERADSLTRSTTTPSPSGSRESSPETFKLRERSPSVQNRLNAFNANPVNPVTVQNLHSRPESISVTATIVRESNQPFPKSELGKDPSEYAPLNLKQSPLVIDHQKAVIAPPQPLAESLLERRFSNSSRTTIKSRRSSLTVVKDLIKDGRASFSDRNRSGSLEPSTASSPVPSPNRSRPPSAHQRPTSVSSRRSTSSREQNLSPPQTAGSSSSNSDEKERKGNRASRMIRRMSSSLSSSRKTLTHAVSPTVQEEFEPPAGPYSRSLASSHPSNYSSNSTNIGDVNVQFPDTLLWKRRSIILDSQGTLILSPALSNGNTKEKSAGGATRRFHLSEFKPPNVPDVEMQELPNSVVLDFIEGGGLQIACEDRAGQAAVLRILQEAHSTWTA